MKNEMQELTNEELVQIEGGNMNYAKVYQDLILDALAGLYSPSWWL
jgi:bacteriocin-like protein